MVFFFFCFAGFLFGAVRFPGVSRVLLLGFPASLLRCSLASCIFLS